MTTTKTITRLDHTLSPVVKTVNLSKNFGDIQAVNSLNLEVSKNSVFALLGPNGSGKTTTLKMLLGLLFPTSGKVNVFGTDISDLATSISSRANIGYLPQDSRFYEYMTAREVLRYSLEFYYSGPSDIINKRVDEILGVVDLEDKADRPISSFSGGERQRLGIAQAQVHYPKLLILDEPAASLDPIGRRDVLKIIESLKSTTTIIYCTHILSDVEKVSDTVAIMNKGQLIKQGPIEQILNTNEQMTYEIKLSQHISEDQLAILRKDYEWIIGLNLNGTNTLTVEVNDQHAAERYLLRDILALDDINVKSFNLRRNNLEDAFMHLITNGGSN